MNNGQMDRGNENPTLIIEENHEKNLSQVGRHRDLNPGPPECESRALPRSHLARYYYYYYYYYYYTTKGLLQGCCLSPILFKIYIDVVLKTGRENAMLWEYQWIPNNFLYNLLFVDDQVLITQGIEDVAYMTRKLAEAYKKWGLKINFKKLNI